MILYNKLMCNSFMCEFCHLIIHYSVVPADWIAHSNMVHDAVAIQAKDPLIGIRAADSETCPVTGEHHPGELF